MKTFTDFMVEMQKIRLSVVDHNDKHERFMKDYHQTTQQNPLNPKERVYGASASTVRPTNDTIHVHDVRAFHQGMGHGTKLMNHLTTLADKHGVKLSLHAIPYTSEESGNKKRLQSWYRGHGFKHSRDNPDHMTRKPRS